MTSSKLSEFLITKGTANTKGFILILGFFQFSNFYVSKYLGPSFFENKYLSVYVPWAKKFKSNLYTLQGEEPIQYHKKTGSPF